MDDFFRTPMGRTFFERTMPELVRQIARLNDNLERMNRANEAPQREGSLSPDKEVR